MSNLQIFREEINRIDRDELLPAFTKRLAIVQKVLEFKRKNNLAIRDEKREAAHLVEIRLWSKEIGFPEEMADSLFAFMMDIYTGSQVRQRNGGGDFSPFEPRFCNSDGCKWRTSGVRDERHPAGRVCPRCHEPLLA